jgi:hypothetical protein
VKLGANVVDPPPKSDRPKRHAEDAFGHDRPPEYSQVLDERQPGIDGVQDMNHKILATMLGLDTPGVEPSTSFYSGCDWWVRPNQGPGLAIPPAWPSTASGSNTLFTPLNVPHGSWQDGPPSRYDDGYGFDEFGGIIGP